MQGNYVRHRRGTTGLQLRESGGPAAPTSLCLALLLTRPVSALGGAKVRLNDGRCVSIRASLDMEGNGTGQQRVPDGRTGLDEPLGLPRLQGRGHEARPSIEDGDRVLSQGLVVGLAIVIVGARHRVVEATARGEAVVRRGALEQ